MVLWHIDPFLGNDRETISRTTAIARQQILNKQQLNYTNRGTVGNSVFYLVHAKGLNTSIIAHRVVGGDAKGTQCLWV
jgi:hypothetical protein